MMYLKTNCFTGSHLLKILLYIIFLLPFNCLAQYNITGRVLNQVDTKPVSNASVFLSNATAGTATSSDGTFTLLNIKPGKYELVVSLLGYETYSQAVTIENAKVKIPDIILFPKSILLNEVKVKFKKDPNREKYFNWFKDEFLGASARAQDCKILNPEILDLNYDEQAKTLKASSGDFLIIENNALGYKIKYLLNNFSLENNDSEEKKVFYQGKVLYEELRGKPAEINRWENNRQDAYENSPMHFLRSLLSNKLEEEGFRVLQFSTYTNPDRPVENLIESKIEFYKAIKDKGNSEKDSLSYWIKKSKLPKTFQKLLPYPLKAEEIIKATNQPGQYSLGCENNSLYIAYNKKHRYHISDQFKYLYNANNTENTLVNFTTPLAFFNSNGVISNPYSVVYYGVWGRNRVADLLPIDYETTNVAATNIENNYVQNIEAKLDTFLSTNEAEKAYLHFDKPYYAAGDTIYFKAYVAKGDNHQLSEISGVLHVDLINTQNKIDQSIKLKIDSGITWGDFTLPDSLPAGNYSIRAYTSWMRNNEGLGFFEKVIPIGSISTPVTESIEKQALNTNNREIDLQFFPEGGYLVTGIRSKVAFKATDANGAGINVNGIIKDQNGKEVCTFASSHLGMGYFYMKPTSGAVYKAKITNTDVPPDEIELPKTDSTGITLTVNNEEISKASVTIAANSTYYQVNKNKDYFLLIYSGGTTTAINFKLKSEVVHKDILKRKLHTGIAKTTLFSPEGEPLCERLLFIQNYDQLSLNINTNKTHYTQREKVSLKLNVKNRADSATSGHFSVSVTNESIVPVNENNENTILTNLLLTADLKGYVEQPNYYFTDTSAEARLNLDILMLSQGYRRFQWKKVLGNEKQQLKYKPEKMLEITGIINSLMGKPIDKGTISLIPCFGGPILSCVSNDKGEFRFSNLVFSDTSRFILSAVKANGQNSTKIIYIPEKPAALGLINRMFKTQKPSDSEMAVYIKNSKNYHNESINYGQGNGILLKEVKIRDKKRTDQYRTDSFAGAGHADQVLHSADLGFGPLVSKLGALLRGVTIIADTAYLTLSLFNSSGRPHPDKMLVVIDGLEQQDISQLKSLQTTDVETIELLKYTSTSMYGMQGGGGVLIVTTKSNRNLDPNEISSSGILPITLIGFYKARQFYSPKYQINNLNNKQKNFRSTIYWTPEINTDKNGNALIEFYNADNVGTYKVVIEGIDKNGNLGRQVFRYKVE